MTDQNKQEGLWRNCKDSIRHALEHFSAGVSEVGASEDELFHHHKWALLSVAHAAEVYGNLLLCVFDPAHPKNGRYPSLDGRKSSVRIELKNQSRLSHSERLVFEKVLEKLAAQRDILMHRLAPEKLDTVVSAIALLSLLHIVRRRTGLPTREFFDQDPPVEQDVLDHIGSRDHERWFGVAEELVKSEYGDEYLHGCDHCGSFAVPPDAPCQACFHEAHH